MEGGGTGAPGISVGRRYITDTGLKYIRQSDTLTVLLGNLLFFYIAGPGAVVAR